MNVSGGEWKKYIDLLGEINKTARDQFMAFFVKKDYLSDVGRQEIIDYAYALATKYGEASAAAACEMYDAIAAASGVSLPAALPGATATYAETAAAINGTIQASNNAGYISSALERLVKQAAADTTVQNAVRDGAEFAWIPAGDTCAFCIMLASNGWQRASKRTMKGNHASHIHANCNCNFAIRFNNDTKYDGYDPVKYRRQYDSAEGGTYREKLNAMRREQYALNDDEIREQKRVAYGKRQN